MPGIRLHPNYHGYGLDSPAFARLLRLATDLGLIVQLALVMEDERVMHPRLRVAPVDPAPLAKIVKQTPALRLILLNALTALRGSGSPICSLPKRSMPCQLEAWPESDASA
jgi:hypothetical protein